MELILLDTGCCDRFFAMATEFLNENFGEDEITLKRVSGIDNVVEYGVFELPAILVSDEVIYTKNKEPDDVFIELKAKLGTAING